MSNRKPHLNVTCIPRSPAAASKQPSPEHNHLIHKGANQYVMPLLPPPKKKAAEPMVFSRVK
jgi:hypothetical protein